MGHLDLGKKIIVSIGSSFASHKDYWCGKQILEANEILFTMFVWHVTQAMEKGHVHGTPSAYVEH